MPMGRSGTVSRQEADVRSGRRFALVVWTAAGVFALSVIAVVAVAIVRAGAEQAGATSLGTNPSALAQPAVRVLPVPALHRLTPPDVIVRVPRAVAPRALHRLRAKHGIARAVVGSEGSIRIKGRRLEVFGLPLAARSFTPSLTATSTALWRSLGRGELTVGFDSSRGLQHRLGATFVAHGSRGHRAPLRVGAFATIALGRAQALVAPPAAAAVGLHPGRVVLVAAPKLSIDALTADVHRTLGGSAQVHVTRPPKIDQAEISLAAQTTIPARYLALYRSAAPTCPGLPWTVLAAIGTVETANGLNVHRSSAGAEGPMQFMPSTWARYGYDANGDGKANIQDPVDAVYSAARYLCAAGAGLGGRALDDAIYAYNHAWWYVREVVNIANSYA
jgi:hypothetical protein